MLILRKVSPNHIYKDLFLLIHFTVSHQLALQIHLETKIKMSFRVNKGIYIDHNYRLHYPEGTYKPFHYAPETFKM